MCDHEEEDETREIIRRHLANDRGAFRELYRIHGERVESIVSAILEDERGASSVDDICQDVWLSVVEAIPLYEDGGCFRAWLQAVARNAALEELRRERRRRKVEDELEARTLRESASASSPPEQLGHGELARDLACALNQLPEEQREAFLLNQQEKLTLDEIAVHQNVRRHTVKRRLELALAKLRHLLRSYRPEALDGSM